MRLVVEANLQRGDNARQLDLPTGRVDVANVPAGSRLWLVCEAPGVLGLRSLDGAASDVEVLAGRVRVVRTAPDEVPGVDAGATLAEIEIAPGERAELRLP